MSGTASGIRSVSTWGRMLAKASGMALASRSATESATESVMAMEMALESKLAMESATA
jgi:hypothetical protein